MENDIGVSMHRQLPRRRSAVSRLAMLAASAAMTATALGVAATAVPAAAAGTPLRQLAEAKGKYFGTALVVSNLSNSTLTGVAGTQFDMVTPGNEMKWDTTEPSNGSFNFGPGDQIVAFAKAHSDRVRGHNLVWHSQLPSWVSSLPSNQVQAAMETHITTEVNHYKGQVYAWDVVNEPFNDDGTFRADAFSNAMGSGYIADAIRTAHAADPNAKLYLNDYNIEGENAKSNAMYSLVQSLISQGVPISGVGLESHFILGQVPSTMLANMQRFAALGVDVAVTELDDRIQLPATSANLAQQATDYSTVVNDCLAVTRCVGVTQWGVGDADSWIPGFFSGFGAATMYDQNYNPKPAYTATQTALGGGGGGNSADRHRGQRGQRADQRQRLRRGPDPDLRRRWPARRAVDQLSQRADLRHSNHSRDIQCHRHGKRRHRRFRLGHFHLDNQRRRGHRRHLSRHLHQERVDRRVHGQCHHQQHWYLGDQRLDAEVHLPRRPEDNERLERRDHPVRNQRHRHQPQLQRHHQPGRQHLVRLPGHLDGQRHCAH